LGQGVVATILHSPGGEGISFLQYTPKHEMPYGFLRDRDDD